MLRSAMDGLRPPTKNFPLPWSQIDSIFDKEEDKSFSASAAACGFNGSPSTGASTVFRTYGAERDASKENK
ncbi:hypothetical protein COP2_039225 [Malus domestica]